MRSTLFVKYTKNVKKAKPEVLFHNTKSYEVLSTSPHVMKYCISQKREVYSISAPLRWGRGASTARGRPR